MFTGIIVVVVMKIVVGKRIKRTVAADAEQFVVVGIYFVV